MPLNVGAPIGSEAYSAAATQNAYANAYGTATAAATNATPNKTIFRYPLDRIDATSDFLEIKIFDYVPGSFGISGARVQSQTAQQRLAPYQQKAKYYIKLPIPQSIADITSITWGDDTLNPYQAGLISLANRVLTEKPGGPKAPKATAENAIQLLKSTFSEAFNDPRNQNALQAFMAAQAANLANANVSAENLVSRASGQILQSNLELIFQGINLRTFPFVFDLAPRSSTEGQEIKDIIRIFKKTMSARSGNAGIAQNSNVGLFIGSPSLYQLTYRSGSGPHPFLHKFKPCALSDISVNYTASNTYATYDDGTPVHMQMTLTFKEINPIYAEDYDTPEGEGGVGY